MKNKSLININGLQFSQEDYLLAKDLGLTRGYGVFDFFLVVNNRPRFFEMHMSRLKLSLDLMNLSINFNELSKNIESLIKTNNLVNSTIKIIVTGGLAMDDCTIHKPNIYIYNEPFNFKITKFHASGTKLITHPYQREFPEIKTTNYLQYLMLQSKLKQENAIDVLYLNESIVRECSRCNIFMVKGDMIFTPKSKILKGITRQRIIDSFNVEQLDFSISDLMNADEVFITSTTKIIVPIVQIDNFYINTGKVGSTTISLLNSMKSSL